MESEELENLLSVKIAGGKRKTSYRGVKGNASNDCRPQGSMFIGAGIDKFKQRVSYEKSSHAVKAVG